MIDKSLVEKRFKKSLKTYNDNAIVQKKMAERLINMLPVKKFNSIFEIGCSTGVLTEKIKKNLQFNEFICNDIVKESKLYIDKIIEKNNFIFGDIEEIEINKKFDLIISNAALQWCNNPAKVIDKLISSLKKNGILAVSIFGSNNLKEIKTILDIKNDNLININGIEETEIVYFNNPIEVLKHIKSTGANALIEYQFTKTRLKFFEEQYKKLYSKDNKVFLTYKPLYIIKKNLD